MLNIIVKISDRPPPSYKSPSYIHKTIKFQITFKWCGSSFYGKHVERRQLQQSRGRSWQWLAMQKGAELTQHQTRTLVKRFHSVSQKITLLVNTCRRLRYQGFLEIHVIPRNLGRCRLLINLIRYIDKKWTEKNKLEWWWFFLYNYVVQSCEVVNILIL